MAFKRALVVDDSKSARISLKRLLEDQGLEVCLADCGEAAIDLLKGELVDVIFMDHTMPGMDGLEALTTIKSDPRTVTIPIMMYTTKEGEVYVSQARALGAVGVLPKQFQPHVLFDMLLELGLVSDRRTAAERKVNADLAPPPADQSRSLYTDTDADSDREYDQQALGMSVQTLVTRILEDQHLSLRADILHSHRDFARQVAAEVYEHQRADSTPDSGAAADGHQSDDNASKLTAGSILIIVATAVIIVLASLYWQTLQSQRALEQTLAATQGKLGMAEDAMQLALLALERPAPQEQSYNPLTTLRWAANRNQALAFNEPAFNERRAQQLEELLDQLAAINFTGEVVVESHLGAFCLVSNDVGGYELAEPELPVLGCNLVGHPLDDSSFPAERQSREFAEFISDTTLASRPGIGLRLIAHDRLSSRDKADYPQSAESAGVWNQAAGLNHRVELSFIPDA
jgi:CheY-like chemotaxis protein